MRPHQRLRRLVALALASLLPVGAMAAQEAGAGPVESPPSARESRVLETVQRFFDALGAGDRAAMEATLLDEVTLVGTRETPNGPAVQILDREGTLALADVPADFLERMWDPTVMIHGTIAVVWTPYDFHQDGTFSHCGIDAFSLVRTSGGWRIASIVWTAEPTGCEPSPLGPPR